jgi:hypothetical protein
LTEKPDNWTHERWLAYVEQRRLLIGERKGQRDAGALKKAPKEAASVEASFFGSIDFGHAGASREHHRRLV